MHLLDSDTFTHLQFGHPEATSRMRSLEGDEIGTTIVNKCEMIRGRIDFLLKAANREEMLRAQALLVATETLLASMTIADFDDAAIARFEELRAVKAYRKIGRADLLVASIALARNATLVTRNQRDFRQIRGLILVNWVD